MIKDNNFEIIKLNENGFFVNIEMLTNEHRQYMAKKLANKYGRSFSPSDIKMPDLNYFQCEFTIPNMAFTFIGKVKDVRNKSLFRVDFFAPIATEERNQLETLTTEYINIDIHASDDIEAIKKNQLEFTCKIATDAEVKSKKRFYIDQNLIDKLELDNRLFGTNEVTYLTKKQLQELIDDIYNRTKLAESFQVRREFFKEEFLKLIKTRISYEEVKIDAALPLLSSFPNRAEAKIDSNAAKNSLFNLFKMNNGMIRVNETEIANVKKSYLLNRFFTNLDIWKSIEYWKSRENIASQRISTFRYCDSFDSFNKENIDNIEWRKDSERFVPRFLTLFKMNKSSLFSKSLVFDRVSTDEYQIESRNMQTFTLKTNELNKVMCDDETKHEKCGQVQDMDEDLFKEIENRLEKVASKLKSDLNFVRQELKNKYLTQFLKKLKNTQKELIESLTSESGFKEAFVKELRGHTDTVFALIQLPNNLLVSGSDDRDIRIWNVTTGENVRTISNAHDDRISDFTFLKNTNLIASASGDRSLKIWHTNDFRVREQLNYHDSRVIACTVLPNGLLVSGGKDKIVIWDLDNTRNKVKKELSQHDAGVFSLRVLPNGRLVSGDDKGQLIIWNTSTFTVYERIKNATSSTIYSIVLLPDGTFATASNEIKVWNSDGKLIRTFASEREKILHLEPIADGCLVSGHEDNTIKIWNAFDATLKTVLTYHNENVNSLLKLSNGDLTSGSFDSNIVILSKDALDYFCAL